MKWTFIEFNYGNYLDLIHKLEEYIELTYTTEVVQAIVQVKPYNCTPVIFYYKWDLCALRTRLCHLDPEEATVTIKMYVMNQSKAALKEVVT